MRCDNWDMSTYDINFIHGFIYMAIVYEILYLYIL